MNSSTLAARPAARESRNAPLWQRLAPVAAALAARREASLAAVGAEERQRLADLGVAVAGDVARVDEDFKPLRSAAVTAALAAPTRAWLRQLDIAPCIDSTNSALLARAARERIHGCVLTTEAQVAGRGRRGRSWLSPFGRNLAVSIGLGSRRPAAEIGALSLVAGLAVRQALCRFGLVGVALKWPNDVLLGGRKLAGILIELVRAAPPLEVVVGIGVNVGCGAAVAGRVDQSVADVAEQIEQPCRNALLAALLDAVVAAAARFEAEGFAAFRTEWQAAHRYHGAAVTVALPAPGASVSGTVVGVSRDGALRIDTGAGVREYAAGEVTLRSESA